MATLNDIAKLAGVSHGTVSNVLSGKGIVSSDKILKVQAAAQKLGYTSNNYAKALRQGTSEKIALVLPNIDSARYKDIYFSFVARASEDGYEVETVFTYDSPGKELGAIEKLKKNLISKVATVTCLNDGVNHYAEAGFETENVLFLERRPQFPCKYIGFDYAMAGEICGKTVSTDKEDIALIVSAPLSYDESCFVKGFVSVLSAERMLSLKRFSIDKKQASRDLMGVLNETENVKKYFVTDVNIALELQNTGELFFPERGKIEVCSLSHLHVLPINGVKTYEFNYSRLGNTAAKMFLGENESNEESVILPSDGFRNFAVNLSKVAEKKRLRVLLLKGPESTAVMYLSKFFTKQTGIEIDVDIKTYDQIYEVLNSGNAGEYDVIRIDLLYLSWFAEETLTPLSKIDSKIDEKLEKYLEGVSKRYSNVHNTAYAVPFDPSVQLLFYRKDLFESSIYKRLFKEKYKKNLELPQSFEEFNRIAEFFTKSINPSSPVEFGATMATGGYSVLTSEFLSRFFEKNANLFDSDGVVRLNSNNAKLSLDEMVKAKKYTPKYETEWWTDVAAEFASGRVAMAIMYSNYASDLLNGDLDTGDQIGYAFVPGNNPILGGASLGVSKDSKNKKEALMFINWICSDEVAPAVTSFGGVSSCRSMYHNYKLVNAYPWLLMAKKSFAIAHGERQDTGIATPFNERLFVNIIGSAVRNVLDGVQGIDEALEWADAEFKKCFSKQ